MENQMEAGLRDGLRMLRHTGGLEKMEAGLRKARSEEFRQVADAS